MKVQSFSRLEKHPLYAIFDLQEGGRRECKQIWPPTQTHLFYGVFSENEERYFEMLALSEERLKCLGKVVRGTEKILFLKLCAIKKKGAEK